MADYPKMLHKYGGLELMIGVNDKDGKLDVAASKEAEAAALKDGWSVDSVETVLDHEKSGKRIKAHSQLAVESALRDGYKIVPPAGGKK